MQLWFALLICASAAVACADPVKSQRRESLGGETSVPRGPTHRPGQPCTWCHDGSYEVEFAIAGTVFATPDGSKPVDGATVALTDATGATMTARSNCAGNFYIFASDWKPTFPVRTQISFGAQTQTMETLIQREASCSACHMKAASQSSPGAVYLWKEAPPPNIPGGCP
jgi:hypothetical protein